MMRSHDSHMIQTGRQRARAGEEPGTLGVLRTKLLHFLRSSRHYNPAEHISSLPDDGQQLSLYSNSQIFIGLCKILDAVFIDYEFFSG